MAEPIRVMVVDDSKLIREMMSDLIKDEEGMELVGTASSGHEAVSKLSQFNPDIITLDIEMPGKDGIATLREILEQKPIPVIMVSALTKRGADVTQEALDVGALDFATKPAGLNDYQGEFRVDLVRKIRTLAKADVQRILRIRGAQTRRKAARQVQSAAKVGDAFSYSSSCIAIGISTGGPPALTAMIPELAPPMPPILIVQHMPAKFTSSLSERLDSLSPLTIAEAKHGDVLEVNHVYIAPGASHMRIVKAGSKAKIKITDEPPVSSHKPSVDVMMSCAAEIFKERCLGVIMTGMGRDGADGCGFVRSAGGYVLGQDESTSDVYGMNKIALQEGNVDRQLPLSDLANAITNHTHKHLRRDLVARTS